MVPLNGLEEGPLPSKFQGRKPHFFKVILSPVIRERQLGMPKKFAMKYGAELSDVATLEVPDGRVWQVGLRKANGQIWFCHGWPAFVEYYSVRHGHFLVFRYDENSCFHVLIFDCTASEIHYPCNPSIDEPNNPVEITDPPVKGRGIKKGDTVQILSAPPPCHVPDHWKTSTTFIDPTELPCSAQTMLTKTKSTCESVPGMSFYQPSKDSVQLGSPGSTAALLARNKRTRNEAAINANNSSPLRQRKRGNLDINCGDEMEIISIPSDSSGDEAHLSHPLESSFNMGNRLSRDRDTKFKMRHPFMISKQRSSALGSGDQKIQRTEFTKSDLNAGKEEEKIMAECRGCHSKLFIGRGFAASQQEERVLHAAEACTSKHPSFSVTIRPSHVGKHCRITVPSAFAKRYLTQKPKKLPQITLQVPDGRTWTVIYNNSYGRLRLRKGWAKFAYENRLKERDICIFQLIEKTNIKLEVTILPFLHVSANLLHERTESGGGTLMTAPRRCHRDSVTKRLLTGQAKERVIQAAKAFTSKFPFFTVTMRPAYVCSSPLNVPVGVVKEYLKQQAGTEKWKRVVTLRMSDGRPWTVEYACWDKSVKLCKGWTEFVLENRLKEGDICAFEMTRKKNIELKVTIFRVVEDVTLNLVNLV